MSDCPFCGNPMIQAASQPWPWCSVYGSHDHVTPPPTPTWMGVPMKPGAADADRVGFRHGIAE